MTDTDQPSLRDRIRRAICEASGFDFDPDWLEPDEFGEHADAVLAVLPAPVDQAGQVWIVWPEDESVLGHYTDEVTAKLAAIEFQQDAEGPGHEFVYAWNEHGSHMELLANGDDTGFRVKREQVLGKVTTTVQAVEMARLRAVDAAYTALVLRAHDMNDGHLIDAIARANREAELCRMADEAQPPADPGLRIPLPGIPECGADCPCRTAL